MILRQAHVIQAAQFDKRYIVSVLYADFRYTIAILSQVALLQLELAAVRSYYVQLQLYTPRGGSRCRKVGAAPPCRAL